MEAENTVINFGLQTKGKGASHRNFELSPDILVGFYQVGKKAYGTCRARMQLGGALPSPAVNEVIN